MTYYNTGGIIFIGGDFYMKTAISLFIFFTSFSILLLLFYHIIKKLHLKEWEKYKSLLISGILSAILSGIVTKLISIFLN